MSSSGRIGAGIPERRAAWRVVALAVLAALAGCATIKEHLPRRGPDKPQPQVVRPTPPKPTPPKPAPPVQPASEFPVLAPATWDRDRGLVRQALAKTDAGALAAADVGYYLDILQGRLRQLAGTQGRATRRGRAIAVDLSSTVRFVPGAAPLGPGSGSALAPLAKLLVEYEHLLVAVRVNADSASAADARLAQQRGLALARALADAGIARKRLVVYGTTPGRPGGTRVEVLLEPVVRAAGGAAAK